MHVRLGRIRTIVAIGLLCPLAASALAQQPTIRCPADPPQVRRLQLQERWRIDPDDPDAPLLGYFFDWQIFARDGHVFMLDAQLCHVLVYTDDGEHRRTIMREGEGPGEIRTPGSAFPCADGRLAVQHGYPTKVELVDPDGTPRGRWTLAANAWARRVQETPRGWFAVYSESRPTDDPGISIVSFHAALHDDDGQRTAAFHRHDERRNFRQDRVKSEVEDYEPWNTAVAVGEDQVVLAPARDEYRLAWRNLAGEVVRVVTRAFPAHVRTREELDRLKSSSYSIVNGEFAFQDREYSDHDPVIVSLDPLPDGGLRVRTSLFEKDLPPGMVCRFEIHAPTGELLERVEILDPTGDYDVEYDAVALLDDGRAMVLRNVRPAARVASDGRLQPELQAKLPPIPDDREDVAFVPIMCELAPMAPGE